MCDSCGKHVTADSDGVVGHRTGRGKEQQEMYELEKSLGIDQCEMQLGWMPLEKTRAWAFLP